MGLFLPKEMMNEIDRRRNELGITRQAYVTLAIYKALQEDNSKIYSSIWEDSDETQTSDVAAH